MFPQVFLKSNLKLSVEDIKGSVVSHTGCTFLSLQMTIGIGGLCLAGVKNVD
jgi:hypothetical protein